jgi:hypothetical protein
MAIERSLGGEVLAAGAAEVVRRGQESGGLVDHPAIVFAAVYVAGVVIVE